MYRTNLFLLQLEHANKFAHSDWPQERRLGLILLDNIFELVIKNKVEHSLVSYYRGWDQKPECTEREKKRILNYFSELLSYAAKKSIINQQEQIIFQFIHEIRNEIFHTSYVRNDKLVRVGLLIACNIIRKDPLRWLTSGTYGYSSEPGYKNKYFSTDKWLIDFKKEVPTVVDKLLTYGKRTKNLSARLLEEVVADEIKSIRHDLKLIREGIDTLDFNSVFDGKLRISNVKIDKLTSAPKKAQLEIILMFYECANNLAEILDEKENRRERCQMFARHFEKQLRKRPNYPLRTIKEFNKKYLKYQNVPLATAILKAKSKLNLVKVLGDAASEAASDYDNYIQHLIDLARGK